MSKSVNFYQQMLQEKKKPFTPTFIDMYSRMGKATSSHFAALNAEHHNKKNFGHFNPDNLLNPALRN